MQKYHLWFVYWITWLCYWIVWTIYYIYIRHVSEISANTIDLSQNGWIWWQYINVIIISKSIYLYRTIHIMYMRVKEMNEYCIFIVSYKSYEERQTSAISTLNVHSSAAQHRYISNVFLRASHVISCNVIAKGANSYIFFSLYSI